jgi:four helix bundle protein
MVRHNRHKRLRVWRSGMRLAKSVYRYTEQLPSTERFALTQQIRRSAVSVPSNIAEGVARGTDRDQRQFLLIARGSLAELATQICLCNELGFATADSEIEDLLDRTHTELCALINRCVA